jgi:uncharacterized protein (TIGR02058 family)
VYHITSYPPQSYTIFLIVCSGEITSCEVVEGGMICSSGTCIEAMGDKNDDCYIVNAAVYVGY